MSASKPIEIDTFREKLRKILFDWCDELESGGIFTPRQLPIPQIISLFEKEMPEEKKGKREIDAGAAVGTTFITTWLTPEEDAYNSAIAEIKKRLK